MLLRQCHVSISCHDLSAHKLPVPYPSVPPGAKPIGFPALHPLPSQHQSSLACRLQGLCPCQPRISPLQVSALITDADTEQRYQDRLMNLHKSVMLVALYLNLALSKEV